MRASDVDWESRTINVARTASAGLNGALVIGPTKGRKSRAVPIADQLLPLAQEAAADKEPYDLLFPGPRGGHINSQNLTRALDWHNVRDSIKRFPPGEPPLRWHDLRHTAAVQLFFAGISAPDVQAILGHSSLQMTRRYSNTGKDAAKRAVPALSAFLTPVGLSSPRRGEAE